jgi:hypothetical protein
MLHMARLLCLRLGASQIRRNSRLRHTGDGSRTLGSGDAEILAMVAAMLLDRCWCWSRTTRCRATRPEPSVRATTSNAWLVSHKGELRELSE